MIFMGFSIYFISVRVNDVSFMRLIPLDVEKKKGQAMAINNQASNAKQVCKLSRSKLVNRRHNQDSKC